MMLSPNFVAEAFQIWLPQRIHCSWYLVPSSNIANHSTEGFYLIVAMLTEPVSFLGLIQSFNHSRKSLHRIIFDLGLETI